jgi:predicted TIM-barrel fold metal-dependent hydrolase
MRRQGPDAKTRVHERNSQAGRPWFLLYDILIFPDQLTYAAELVAAFPQQKFVLDHISQARDQERKYPGLES